VKENKKSYRDEGAKKMFRRWLLRRRPVTEVVMRRNNGDFTSSLSHCKPDFAFFTIFFYVTGENMRRAPFSILVFTHWQPFR
jgi:hypothetical protein